MIDLEQSNKELKKSQKVLQESYITLCLKLIKPSIQLKEFIQIQNSREDILVIQQNQLGYLKVYDQLVKQNKMLIICLSEDFEKYNLFYQEITNQCLRSDMILKMIDQYYLDTDRLFYVFEMECFDFTLTQFKNRFQLEHQMTQKIQNFVQKFYQQNVEIFYQKNFKDLQEYFVQINSNNQLIVKFNLIDPNWDFESYFQKHQIVGSTNINFSKTTSLLSEEDLENKIEQKEQELIEEIQYSNNEILDMINGFQDYFNNYVQKKEFLKYVQNLHGNVLRYHPLEIFEVIQNHPLYDQFKFEISNQSMFELHAYKRDKVIILQGFSHQNLSQAEEQLSLYNKLLSNPLFTKNTSIISAELLMFEKQSYVLVEKMLIEKSQKQNCCFLKNESCFEEIQSLIHLSYELFTICGLQITKINPSTLFRLNKQGYNQLYDNAIKIIQDGNFYKQTKQNINFYQKNRSYFESKLEEVKSNTAAIVKDIFKYDLYHFQEQTLNDENMQQEINLTQNVNIDCTIHQEINDILFFQIIVRRKKL
ncbi:hypothetical protein TTHERM_01102810 (macronuclear) [Tetrahymena thermophila SB210]|uniref:Uncharacterized protein n=1 Tax=Tetrahymena thermophila (strain SB210) TaxID=312017 RepID=Q23RM9_TETTS|nr:hypothetical protein TTHERM_01102810 [Tetrahymena thermophila SB210]EAR99208.2 hypothetical protein TTHERM_01102810 [Tetrahymena thermophila SB210]|eukprot:XP_001019453.2 hypothetical protein TTHERM_01102810 [Tetrahymena thermophila SB210]